MPSEQPQSRIQQAENYRLIFDGRPEDVLEGAEWNALPNDELVGRITCESLGDIDKSDQEWLTDAYPEYVIKPGPNQRLWIEVVR